MSIKHKDLTPWMNGTNFDEEFYATGNILTAVGYMQVLPKEFIKRFWVDACFQFRSLTSKCKKRQWDRQKAKHSWKYFQIRFTNKEIDFFRHWMSARRDSSNCSRGKIMEAHRLCRRLNVACGVVVGCPLCNDTAIKLSVDAKIPRQLYDLLKEVNPTAGSPTRDQMEKEQIDLAIADVEQTIIEEKACRILRENRMKFVSGAKKSIDYSELKQYTQNEVQQMIDKVIIFDHEQKFKILNQYTIELTSFQCNLLRAIRKLSPSNSQWKNTYLIYKHYVGGTVKYEYHSKLKVCDVDAIEGRSFVFGRFAPSLERSTIIISDEVRAYMDISKMEMFEKIREIAKNAISESILAESKKRGKELIKVNDTKRNKYEIE